LVRLGRVITLSSLVAALVLPVAMTTTRADAVGTSPGTYFGAYVQPRTGWTRADQEASINNLESYLGRTLDIDHVFHPWGGKAFPSWRQVWDLQRGRIPMISWSGTYLTSVLNGSHDDMIRARADGLAGLGGRVLLRWFGEMDAGIYENDEIESPDQFVRAWRYVHDVFVSRGATNVEWVWCPNSYAFGTGEAQRFFPGDAYVDWICADGYNWAPARPSSDWRSFEDTFAPFYAWAASKPQPLLVGETGVMENGPGDKATWVLDMGNTIKSVYPEIKALVYFDAYSTANFGGWYDWRMDTSASSYAAFKTIANDPHFSGEAMSEDTTPPSVPGGLQAATSGSRVDLTWESSVDNVAVQGYEVLRDGLPIASVSSTAYTDPAVAPGTSYSYSVRAFDAANNMSDSCGAATVTVPETGLLFSDGFESGSLSAWTTMTRMTIRDGGGHSGSFAAVAQSTGASGSFSMTAFPEARSEVYVQAWFKVEARSSLMNLLRLQSAGGANIVTVFVSKGGDLMVRNDVRATNLWSPARVGKDVWHQIQLRARVGTPGLLEVWYDGQRISQLSMSQNLGTASIGRLLIGDNVSGRTYRSLVDDVSVSGAPIV
jgi:endoglucanase